MIKKLFIYLQSAGLQAVLNYARIRFKKIYYYKSETIFYFLHRKNYNKSIKIPEINFVEIDNPADLEKVNLDRIKTLDYNRWLNKGSLAIIGFRFSRPVSFTWSHYHSHRVHGSYKINLSHNKCWTGPSFVDRSLRGNKINQAQKHFQIMNAPKSIEYFLTSVSAKNIASIKSIEKIGFIEGLKMIKYYGAFSSKKTERIFKNNGESIFQIQE